MRTVVHEVDVDDAARIDAQRADEVVGACRE
jgi:hypothetical protein